MGLQYSVKSEEKINKHNLSLRVEKKYCFYEKNIWEGKFFISYNKG